MHEEFNACEWLLDRNIEEGRGDKTAIRCEGESTTYAELLDLVTRAATGLRALGVRPEERVAMVTLDSVQMTVAFLAAMRIGAVPVLVNPLLPGADLGVIVADARARVLVISDERSGSLADLMKQAHEVEHVVTTSGDTGTTNWADFTAANDNGDLYTTWYDSPGFWLCTSGTTGMPKLAMHTHGDLAATQDTYGANVVGITEDDISYSVGPMFHAYGLGNSLTFPFAVGATVVLVPTRPPTPQMVADILIAEKPTLFFCIPTFYAALTNAELPSDTFASVRCGFSAAEALPAETFNRFKGTFGVTILDGIGSTELLHVFLSNSAEQTKAGTTGVPVPGYEMKVVDSDGVEVPVGQPGELFVKGPTAATGYWCRSETSEATFHGPWVRTGDMYVCSEDGFYTYWGRADDMLRVGGEWVAPAQVEGVLIEHPEVLEAAVVGVRDEGGIQRPVAHVIPAPGGNPTAEGLTDWCKERLAGYKRPRRYEIVSELPKTATGKIQRFKLR